MTADTFALDVSAFVKKAQTAPAQVVRKVTIELLRNVVLATPVGNPTLWKSKHPPKGYVGGRLRANWNVSVGSPDLGTRDARDKSGSATIATGAAHALGADGVRDVYIMNSLPYVREIEYTGHSSQAPAGMVRVTVARYQAFIAAAAKGFT